MSLAAQGSDSNESGNEACYGAPGYGRVRLATNVGGTTQGLNFQAVHVTILATAASGRMKGA